MYRSRLFSEVRSNHFNPETGDLRMVTILDQFDHAARNGKTSRGSKFRISDAGSCSRSRWFRDFYLDTWRSIRAITKPSSREDRAPFSLLFRLPRPAVSSLLKRSSSFLVQSFIVGFRHPPLFVFSSRSIGSTKIDSKFTHTHIHFRIYVRACGRRTSSTRMYKL